MRLAPLGVLAGFLVWLASPAVAQPVAGGERIYAERCARCHETAIARVPTRAVLADYLPETIENSLSTFAMRSVGEDMTHAERRAVAEYLTGMPAGSFRAPLEQIPASAYCSRNPGIADPLAGASWSGWSPGLANTRLQNADDAGLTAEDVPELELRWAFGIPGVSSSGSQVAIAGNRIFVGARNGMLWSLDRETGCIAFAFQADGGIRSTPVVVRDVGSGAGSGAGSDAGGDAGGADADGRGRGTVFFGDSFAQVYALDALSGELIWKSKVDDHAIAMITGGTSYHEGRLYVPVSSIEESPALMPDYECCSFRGSLVALDAGDGSEIWKTRTISRGPEPTGENRAGARSFGPSGAAIWSAPTIDPLRGRVYVATGDNYTHPATTTSDAIMAFELASGRVLWTQQTLPNDVWNVSCIADEGERFNCPEDEGPDFDFGSSPVLATRADGSGILLAGQKSGVLYGLDPEDGALLWERRVGDGGVFGGIEWGFAADGDAAYVSLSSLFEKAPGEAGGLAAVDLRDGSLRWQAPPAQGSCDNRVGCNTAQPGAVSAIPGVVFSGSVDGHLRAYDAGSGEIVFDYDTVREFDTVNGVPAHGGSFNGPGAAIAGGMLFVTPGYAVFGLMPGNVLLAFGVDD